MLPGYHFRIWTNITLLPIRPDMPWLKCVQAVFLTGTWSRITLLPIIIAALTWLTVILFCLLCPGPDLPTITACYITWLPLTPTIPHTINWKKSNCYVGRIIQFLSANELFYSLPIEDNTEVFFLLKKIPCSWPINQPNVDPHPPTYQ